MNKFFEIIKSNKKKFYIILVVSILIVIIFIYNTINNKKNNKELSNKNYVFTQIKNGNKQKLPYINIKSDKVDMINDSISTEYFDTVLNDENTFTYNYYVEKEILYIFINIEKYNNNVKTPKYIAYYININDGKVYDIKEILKLHKLNYDEVESQILKNINSAYVEEVELGYVEQGFCDFDCYLDIHDVNPLNNNLMLSYDGKNLKMYLNYTVETIYYVENKPVTFPHEFDL